MLVKYCNADCQKNHWPKHKKLCKQRVAELCDEALFKAPLAKEDCPIFFLPSMPVDLICYISLPPATISSIPIDDYAGANEYLTKMSTEKYHSCCGKSVRGGCIHSFAMSGNIGTCPYCKAETGGKTKHKKVEEMMKRVEANDASAMYALGNYYHLEWKYGNRLRNLGTVKRSMTWRSIINVGEIRRRPSSTTRSQLWQDTNLARINIGSIDFESGNMERAVKHWVIAATAGHHQAMNAVIMFCKKGYVSRESVNTTLAAYNSSCVEMRSKARDAFISC